MMTPHRATQSSPSAKTDSLGGFVFFFFFKARNSRKISLPLFLIFPLELPLFYI